MTLGAEGGGDYLVWQWWRHFWTTHTMVLKGCSWMTSSMVILINKQPPVPHPTESRWYQCWTSLTFCTTFGELKVISVPTCQLSVYPKLPSDSIGYVSGQKGENWPSPGRPNPPPKSWTCTLNQDLNGFGGYQMCHKVFFFFGRRCRSHLWTAP